MTERRAGLARARVAAGYTQESLADAMGVDWRSVRRWESGTQTPQPYRREKLAKILGCDLRQLDALLDDHSSSRSSHEVALHEQNSPGVDATSRTLQALEIVASDDVDTLDVATDCLNELIPHFSENLSVLPPAKSYDDLLNVRSFAGGLLRRTGLPSPRRKDLAAAAGWLSNLLAVATSNMGDHGSALVWCVDAERRGYESGHRDIAGWATLTRAMIAYYQGRTDQSVETAMAGQNVSPLDTVAHAKLAAHEMRARAMRGDLAGMTQSKAHATKALAALTLTTAQTGVFAITLAEDPPYTATSLLHSGQFREASTVTKGIIQSAYPADTHNHNRKSTSYARTLLILALAEAGLGRVDAASAAGRAALNTSTLVWPTLVLAGKLDRVLMRSHGDVAEVADYHALYLDMIDNHISDDFQRTHTGPNAQGTE